MGVKFFNINSGETRVCETEPMIAAFWGSSDRSPNVTQGQDRGWRLAPETVIEIRRIQGDSAMLQTIALTYQLPLENITESDILAYISEKSEPKTTGMDHNKQEFQKQYQDEIRALEAKNEAQAVIDAKADEPINVTGPEPETPASAPDDEDTSDVDEEKAEEAPPLKPEVSVDMTRPQLEEVADGLGIPDLSQFKTKTQLVQAINDRMAKNV